MTTTQVEATDRLVTAEDAPIGQLLWPVRSVIYAENFTLESVTVTRTGDRAVVTRKYENGVERYFSLGEQVLCRF